MRIMFYNNVCTVAVSRPVYDILYAHGCTVATVCTSYQCVGVGTYYRQQKLANKKHMAYSPTFAKDFKDLRL